jgi:hypothetical protein
LKKRTGLGIKEKEGNKDLRQGREEDLKRKEGIRIEDREGKKI